MTTSQVSRHSYLRGHGTGPNTRVVRVMLPGLTTLIILVGAVPAALLASHPIQRDLDLGCLFLFIALYTGARLAQVAFTRASTPALVVFYVFCYVSLGIAPLSQTTTQVFTVLAPSVSHAVLVEAGVLGLAGIVAFEVSYRQLSKRRVRIVKGAPKARHQDTSFNLVSLRWAAAISLLLSATYAYLVGVGALFASREDATTSFSAAVSSENSQANSAIISAFGSVPVLVILLAYLTLSLTKGVRLSIPDWIFAGLLLTANAIVNNPLSNSRYWSLTVILALVFCIGRRVPAALAWIGVAGAVAAIVVFPVADFSRYSAGVAAAVDTSGDTWQTLAIKDYDQYTMLANAIAYVHANGLAFGYQAIGALLFWVPRSVWPLKPLDTGVAVGQWMQVSNVNLSSPAWAEGFVNLGVLGTLSILSMLGIAAAYFDHLYRQDMTGHSSGRLAWLVCGFVYAGYQFILLRGPLLQAMGKLGVLLLMTGVLVASMWRKNHPTSHLRGFLDVPGMQTSSSGNQLRRERTVPTISAPKEGHHGF